MTSAYTGAVYQSWPSAKSEYNYKQWQMTAKACVKAEGIKGKGVEFYSFLFPDVLPGKGTGIIYMSFWCGSLPAKLLQVSIYLTSQLTPSILSKTVNHIGQRQVILRI